MFYIHRYNVVLTCWERSPDERPHFSELVSKLSSFLSSMADYFDLVLSNPAAQMETEKKLLPAVYSMSPIEEGIEGDTAF